MPGGEASDTLFEGSGLFDPWPLADAAGECPDPLCDECPAGRRRSRRHGMLPRLRVALEARGSTSAPESPQVQFARAVLAAQPRSHDLPLSPPLSLADRIRALNAAACDVLCTTQTEDAAPILQALLKEDSFYTASGAWEDPLGLGCEPPPADAWASLGGNALADASHALLTGPFALPWKQPKDLSAEYSSWASGSLRSIMLTGQRQYGATLLTDDCYAGIWWLAPNSDYPCHAHAADETFIILCGGEAAHWHVDDHLPAGTVLSDGSVIRIPPRTPHSVKTGAKPLLVWYCWTGDLKGEYFFCEHASRKRPLEEEGS